MCSQGGSPCWTYCSLNLLRKPDNLCLPQHWFLCAQVLIGHSERRGEFGILAYDSNATLATKLKYILDAGMSCVFCIGEPKSIREKGLDAVLAEMDKQLEKIYGLLDPAKVCSDVCPF